MVKITTLIEEGSSCGDLASEHGLSLYIETENHKILFDTGASDRFAENADKLGVNIADIDIAFLSHGHYDHGGGIAEFFRLNNRAKLYVNKRAFGEYWAKDGRYVGIASELKDSKRVILAEDEVYIDEELKLTAFNNRIRKYHMSNYGLMKKEDGVLKDDDFLHEQYLKIYDKGECVLISGCSHKGILNIIDWCGEAPRTIVGGFHFMKVEMDACGKEYLRSVAEKLNEYPSQFVTCHCTGEEQYNYLKKHMGEKLKRLRTGDVVTV